MDIFLYIIKKNYEITKSVQILKQLFSNFPQRKSSLRKINIDLIWKTFQRGSFTQFDCQLKFDNPIALTAFVFKY